VVLLTIRREGFFVEFSTKKCGRMGFGNENSWGG
jgi:hypothetical protein